MTTGKVSIRQISPCLLPIIIDSLGFGLVYPVMAALFGSNHTEVLPANTSDAMRHFYLGLGYLLFPLFMFFGAPFLGDLSDLWGRRKVLLVCMFGMLISFTFMGLGVSLSSLSLLLIGRAINGLMAGSQPIAQAAIVDLSTPETKTMNLSLITLTISVGIIGGPLMGGITSDTQLSPYFNFATPFFISAVFSFIALIWVYVGFKETFNTQTAASLDLTRFIRDFISAFRNKKIRLLAFIFLFMQIGWSTYMQIVLLMLQYQYKFTSSGLGFFNGWLGVGFVVGMTVVIRILLKRFDVSYVGLYSFFIAGIAELLTAVLQPLWSIWLMAFFTAAFDMVAYTAMMACFSDAVSADKQGWVMGVFGSIMAVAFALTGLTPNLLSFLSVRAVIGISGAGAMLLSFLLMIRYCRHHHNTA